MSLDRCVCGLYHLWSLSFVLCTLCYLCLWTVVCVVFIICLVSCVPCVTYVSGPLCVWSLSFVVVIICLVYPVLSMSLDRCVCGLYHCLFVITPFVLFVGGVVCFYIYWFNTRFTVCSLTKTYNLEYYHAKTFVNINVRGNRKCHHNLTIQKHGKHWT